jgi:hypothetical protein
LMRFCFISIVKRGHLLLPTFNPTKRSRKEKRKKIQNTRGYTWRKPRSLPNLVMKDQNDKWKSWRINMHKIGKIGNLNFNQIVHNQFS